MLIWLATTHDQQTLANTVRQSRVPRKLANFNFSLRHGTIAMD